MKKNTKISFIIFIFLVVVFGFCVTNSAGAYYNNWQYVYNTRNNEFNQTIRPISQNNNFYNEELFFNGNGNWSWVNYLQTLVQTKSVDTDDNEATFSGTIYTDNIDYAYVWFEYGENPNFLNDSTSEKKIDGDDGSVTFEKTVTGLDEDTRYFFRAVGEEKNGRRAYGGIMSFVTSDNYYDNDGNDEEDEDTPEVNTGDAKNITESYAKIGGDVDMNDFDSGIVFFVYGEDETQVEDISDDYDTYSDIDEDDEDLQKVKVDSSLDDDSYTLGISNLNDDTDYYYRMCVQYENEDGGDEIQCGDVESFTTDED